MILHEVSPIAAIFQATLCGSACITANTRSAGQCNSFLFIEQDKECKLGKAALYERDFKEQGGMEVFVKLNLDGSLPIASDGWFSSWPPGNLVLKLVLEEQGRGARPTLRL